MVEENIFRLTSGAAAFLAFAILMTLFAIQPVSKEQVFKGLKENTVGYRVRQDFYDRHNGKVSYFDYVIEVARTQFSQHDVSRY